MAGLRKTRRVQLIVIGLVLLFSASGLVMWALTVSGAAQYSFTPTQVVETPPRADEYFRIGGLVEEGSLVRGQGETVTFNVTDTNRVVKVAYTGVLPDLFREGQGVVAMGYLRGDVMEATEILARHDEKYMPKEAVDALKDQGVYKGE